MTGRLARFVRYCAAGAALAASSATWAADKKKVELSPATDWSYRPYEEFCRISRTFGVAPNQVLVQLDRFGPGPSFVIRIAGTPLAKLSRQRAKLRFGPSGAQGIGGFHGASIGAFAPGIYTKARLLTSPEPETDRPDYRDIAGSTRRELSDRSDRPNPAMEDAVLWAEVKSAGARPIILHLGPMAEPMGVLRQCADAMVARWGFDPAVQRNLIRPPLPASDPGRWMVASDYPTGLLRKGAQGSVYVRLDVDREGNAVRCHVQQATRPEGFADVVCRATLSRASFLPALGPGGEPVESFWQSSVRFEIP